MSTGRLLALFLTALTLARWYAGFSRPLSADECYLALCGFIPSPAYFDGPGGTPWLVAAGISLVGAGGFGATFFWPVMAAMASAGAYFLVGSLVGKKEGLGIAVFLNLFPVFNEASVSATCAMPLTAAGLATSLCAWHGLEKRSAGWWAAAGLCAAVGLLFTYTAWFLLPSLTLVLAASHRWRPRLATAGFWLAWVPPLTVYFALLLWNESHGWVHFIGGTWQTAFAVQPGRSWDALMAAAGGLGPFAFPVLLVAGFMALARMQVSPKLKFLVLPAFVAVLSALYASLRGLPTATPGLLAAALSLPLLAWLPSRLLGASTKKILAAVFLGTAAWTALPDSQLASVPLVDSNVGSEVDRLRSDFSGAATDPLFLIAENGPLAAALALALPDPSPAAPGHPPVYTLESAAARSQFDLWPRYDQIVEGAEPVSAAGPDPFTEQKGTNPFIGKSALYLTTQPPTDLPQAIAAAFANVQLLGQITAPNGLPLLVYLCSDYQMMPL